MPISEARRRSPVGFNMTPMIDVVFLLIIFFLVTSHFGRQETSVEVELPKAAGGNPAEDEQQTHRLTVSIPAAGELFLGSREVTREELTRIFAEEKNRRREPFQLRIRAAKTVPFRDVEPILKAAAGMGIRDVQFGVVK